MSKLISPAISDYLESLVPPRHPELARIERDAAATDFPIIGPAAGQFCYLLARMMGATRVFELGSGFGYSTAWFARAVRENGGGIVHHVVWDEDLSRRAREHLAVLELIDLVTFTIGEAVAALNRTEGPFDLIFNDIEKRGYPDALPVIAEKLRPGGVLVIDNMFWDGQIFDDADHSPDTDGVRRFTQMVTASPEWEVTLVPIRDGLIVARKRG